MPRVCARVCACARVRECVCVRVCVRFVCVYARARRVRVRVQGHRLTMRRPLASESVSARALAACALSSSIRSIVS